MSPSPVDPDTIASSSDGELTSPANNLEAPYSDPSKFQPIDRSSTTPVLKLPEQRWLTVLETKCTFGADLFEEVMLNFIKNPNVTSSFLFRADILFDTESNRQTQDGQPDRQLDTPGSDIQPRQLELPGWTQKRLIVRLLIPRNQQLDRPMTQTCILFTKPSNDNSTESLMVYIPHVDSPQDMPFYHPRTQQLAFHHSFQPSTESANSQPNNSAAGVGSLSISYNPFASCPEVDTKLHRTGLKLLQTIHKHGQGQLGGYKKRVHHDQLIPQKSYQDTYSRLKAKYGRKLTENWVEVTDPSKHVFEDLGIAAFCLELWREMYEVPDTAKEAQAISGAELDDLVSGVEDLNVKEPSSKPQFPGFVDIGCGNGLLVYILLSEGYPGSGFDARERKTWETFPPSVRQHLRQSLLVPELLRPGSSSTSGGGDTSTEDAANSWHPGLFPPGTFIISNHADELTAWTPLLAYLNQSAFIAIPCCSHDLAGSRFRAPDSTKAQKARASASKKSEQRNEHAARLPQQEEEEEEEEETSEDSKGGKVKPRELRLTQAAETGSLKRTLVHKKMASAYSTLCAYVNALADAVGFEAEEEVLRIPSTRNHSIIGRRRRREEAGEDNNLAGRRAKVIGLVEEELGREIEDVGKEWAERAEKLAKKPSSGH
jgi:tRNASer (uridine44-2'-O)-methyltransferase